MAESMSIVDAEEADTEAPFTAQGWLERLWGLREGPATGGSHPPSSTPRQDAAGGDPGDIVMDQALEANDPGFRSTLISATKNVLPKRHDLVQMQQYIDTIFDYDSIFRISHLHQSMRHVCFFLSPKIIVCWQVHNKASALKEYTGQHLRNASRDRLARVRGFTNPSGEVSVQVAGTDQTDYGTRLQIGAPFATFSNSPCNAMSPPRTLSGFYQQQQHHQARITGSDRWVDRS